MYLFFLALPLSMVVVGLFYYQREKGRAQEDEDPPAEGYYVYPAPLPHQSALHPSHYWMAPGAVDPHGYPKDCEAFGPQPEPYKVPSHHQKSLSRSPDTPEVLPSFHDSQIQLPAKIAQPGLPSVSNTITSEKMLAHNESSLPLPPPTITKNTPFLPLAQNSSWTKQDVEYTNQHHSKHNTPPQLSAIQERLSIPPREANADAMNFIGETAHSKGKGDNLTRSGLGRQCAFGSDSVDSFPLSMRTVEPAPGTGTDQGRDITDEMVPEAAQINIRQSVANDVGSVEAQGLGGDLAEPLPRYTSADARIFEQFKNRLSFKQDHSYIGRLRDSYHPPETVSPSRRVIRDDNFYLKTSSPSDPKQKP